MALACFDSSASVKLVVDEAGSDLAADLWDHGDAALSSRLAYPEVRAAAASSRLRHTPRGADAVHLASALAVASTDLVVAVWDRRLHAGVVAENLAVAPTTPRS